jgi:hypothetical protein
MSKRQLLSLIGVWNIFFLFLGIPTAWDKILSILVGIIIIMIAYRLPYEEKKKMVTDKEETFVENK